VESFLLAHWEESGDEQTFGAGPVSELAKRTLAYHLASSEQRGQLVRLFELLAANVTARAGDSERRRVYGRTLFGIGDTVALEEWVAENLDRIAGCDDVDELFNVVWPCISARIENDTYQKWRPLETREAFARRWIAGDSFGAIHGSMAAANARIGLGAKPRKPKVEHIVEMGENALGFDGAHVLGAMTELFRLRSPEAGPSGAVAVLQTLQKRLKYGLPSEVPILLYEAGFADRPLASDLAVVVSGASSRANLQAAMRQSREAIEDVLGRYPQYFWKVYERVAG
jgi:hypothetical protein